MSSPPNLNPALQRVRQAFDHSFTLPLQSRPPRTACVRITCGGATGLVPAATLSSVIANLKLTPFPSRKPALIGMAQVHGAIVPVYDLSQLRCGQPSSPSDLVSAIVLPTPTGPAALACGKVHGLEWHEDEALQKELFDLTSLFPAS